MTTAPGIWQRLRWRLWLWTVLLATTLTPPAIFAYDGQHQTTVAYDSSSESAVRYGAHSVPSTSEKRDGTTGDRVIFGEFHGFLAAKTTPTSLNAAEINFSQRTVSGNVQQYTTDMANGNWDWSRSGPVRVMERDGQWVSYDNRRVMAAQNAGLNSVPVQVVQSSGIGPNGMTWGDAFNARFHHPWNVEAGGAVPNTGLSSQPTIFIRKPQLICYYHENDSTNVGR